ncbi:MAG: ribonuclease P protein component 1 [Candidatus Micrarchaeota archaeon]|nr:ribonuclease P protein component 1 [Candidatus Micrarchaeota archaeon]
MITKKNIIVHELIGLNVAVSESKSKPYVGVKGVVIDETLNTLIIESSDGKMRRIPKKGCVFEFVLPSGEAVRVKGADLLNYPENRIKRNMHKI